MEHDLDKFGIGEDVRPNPQAYRDWQEMGFALATAVGEPLITEEEWDEGFMCKDVPDEDQNGSGSCTCQAFGYDFCARHDVQLSRNDMYSRVGRPDQSGAMAHEPYALYKATGVHTRANSPDPVKQTESAMKKLVNIDKPRHHEFDLNYWSPPNYDINTIAAFIKMYDGGTGCYHLTYEGWKSSSFPKAPKDGDRYRGSHMTRLAGFKRINGKKYIIHKSSWKSVKFHHLGEDYYYLGSQHVFGHYRPEYWRKSMPQETGFVEFLNFGGKIAKVEYIDIPENFVYQAKLQGYDVPIIKNPDGTPKRDEKGNIMPDWARLPFNIKSASVNS